MRTRWVAFALVIGLTACGGGGDDASEGGTDGAGATTATAVADAATITGSVKFEGAAPANEAIDMSGEPDCAKKHTTPPVKHTVVANGNGTLRNVFVYVKDGLAQGNYPARSDSPVLDQEGCEYKPRVIGLQGNQELTIKNSDGLLHNVNAKPTTNRGFNVGQPTNMETKKSFTQQEVMIPVTCEVHGWMEGFVGVVSHPFFAVTGDDGSFKIEGLPPGTYTLEAWHEKYGTKTVQVTVAANETKAADFSYNAAATAMFVPMGKAFDPHGAHTSAAHR